MKAHNIILVTLMVVLVSACDRAGEEVQLQEGARLPQSTKSEKQRNRLLTIQHNGQEITVNGTCTEEQAVRMRLTETQANDPSIISAIIGACKVEPSNSRGAHGSYSIYLGYWYPQDYNNYSYNGFGCNLFFGSYSSGWNTNCAYTWGGYQPNWYWGSNWSSGYGSNYCYNYYSSYYGGSQYNYNTGYYYYPSYPQYCYYRY